MTCCLFQGGQYGEEVVEFGIQETTGFTDIRDAELDGLVQQFMLEHGSLIGCSMISGRVRSLGLRMQR